MAKIRCAVLGATGVVGQHFLRLLVNHPFFELVAIAASDVRTGQILASAREIFEGGIPDDFRSLQFDPLDAKVIASKQVRLAFSALPADVAKDIEIQSAEHGIHIFSNAGSYRMDPHVPILIPELNASHLELVQVQQKIRKGFIVTNANCTTTGLTVALAPFRDLGIRKVIVASYQAISGAGYPGVPALDILGNVIPHINGEEEKVRKECVKIMGHLDVQTILPADWEIHAHCIRVPTPVGHFLSIHLETEQTITHQQAVQRIVDFRTADAIAKLPTAPQQPIYFYEDPLRPQPKWDSELGFPKRAKGMAIAIGRLEVNRNIIRFVTLSNNLVRGAAGGSILNAELAHESGLL